VVQALQGGQARRTQGAAIIRAIGLICANLAQPLRVEQLAAESGLSPSRFHECFVADTGETPAAYQLRLRCLRAAELLRARSDSPVKAIAASLGFSDQRYFSTCFKRQMGMTPSEFRSTGLEKSH
jgi:AraC-like DNA-binding protein